MPATYTNLCHSGTKFQHDLDSHLKETRRLVYLLQDAEQSEPGRLPYYRDQLAKLRVRLQTQRIALSRHVAHCTDGCTLVRSGSMDVTAWDNGAAPSHQKPPLELDEIRRRLGQGESLEVIAQDYGRAQSTISSRLAHAGFSSLDGQPLRPLARAESDASPVFVLVDQPWAQDALCAQTDPEAFFPEKGGSTREAKSVCQRCTVAAECLDWALDNEERFGIWGGLSERERRRIKKQLESRRSA